MNVVDEIELIAQRVFGSLTTHVNKMNWGIYKKQPHKRAKIYFDYDINRIGR